MSDECQKLAQNFPNDLNYKWLLCGAPSCAAGAQKKAFQTQADSGDTYTQSEPLPLDGLWANRTWVNHVPVPQHMLQFACGTPSHSR